MASRKSFGTRGPAARRGGRQPARRVGVPRLSASGSPTARDVAILRLERCAGSLFRLDAKEQLETDQLEERDAALAHAIVDAALRRWLTIAALLDACIDRSFKNCEPPVQGALACGAAQLLFLDRIPDHAAVDSSVEWTSRSVGRRAGGLVNASLRRLVALRADVRSRWTDRCDEVPLADGGALAFSQDVLTSGVIARLSASTSHHRSFISRWSRQFEKTRVQELAVHSVRKAPTIINGRFAESVLEDSLLTPHEMSGHWVFNGGRDQLVEFLRNRHDVWVQDPASAAVVTFCQRLSPSLIVDMCAGKGTKTRGLAAAFPEATIVATDVDTDQRQRLQESTMHLANVEVREPMALADLAGRADLVLLDVPCSNSGVLARRIEARYRGATTAIERLVSVQQGIIAEALPLVRKGGSLVYATCSVEEEENRRCCEAAARASGLRLVEDQTTLPHGGPGKPDTSWTDASYACLLSRG